MLNYIFKIEEPALVNSAVGNITMGFTVGAFVGVIMCSGLADKLGRIKLLIFVEVLAGIVCLLHQVESLGVLMIARILSGFSSSISAVMGAIVLKEMFPERYFSTGGVSGYLFLVVTLELAWLVNPLFGNDKEVIASHWRLILLCPIVVSIIRIILLVANFGFGRIESPNFWYEKYREAKDQTGLKEHLTACFEKFYSDQSVEFIVNSAINEFNSTKNSWRPNCLSMLSNRFRRRLMHTICMNVMQQLTGINFLIFFSTQIFDKLSGNGGTMTLVVGAANIAGGFLGMMTLKRISKKDNLKFGVLG